MANNPKDVRCFLGQVSCPTSADPSTTDGVYTCRAWDGEECVLITLVEDLLSPKMTIMHPDSAAPPEVKS